MESLESKKPDNDLLVPGDERAQIVVGWIQAFNARKIEELLDLYATDAVHISPNLRREKPETHGQIHGRTGMKEWWEDCFKKIPGLHYELLAMITEGDDKVIFSYLREAIGQENRIVREMFTIRNKLIIQSEVLED